MKSLLLLSFIPKKLEVHNVIYTISDPWSYSNEFSFIFYLFYFSTVIFLQDYFQSLLKKWIETAQKDFCKFLSCFYLFVCLLLRLRVVFLLKYLSKKKKKKTDLILLADYVFIYLLKTFDCKVMLAITYSCRVDSFLVHSATSWCISKATQGLHKVVPSLKYFQGVDKIVVVDNNPQVL